METTMTLCITILIAVIGACSAQRSPYAGRRPIGYPEMEAALNTGDALSDRFGDGSASTEKLPVEALGDRQLVERISKLPLDKQPFWYLNWKALEEHRTNPKTYSQNPNSFVDPISSNFQQQSNFGNNENRNGGDLSNNRRLSTPIPSFGSNSQQFQTNVNTNPTLSPNSRQFQSNRNSPNFGQNF